MNLAEKSIGRGNLRPKAIDGLRECKIPNYMRDGIIRYVEEGLHPGGFLTAVISNDLKLAVGRADDINKKLLPNYVEWFVWYAPMACWGSRDAFRRWIGMVEK